MTTEKDAELMCVCHVEPPQMEYPYIVACYYAVGDAHWKVLHDMYRTEELAKDAGEEMLGGGWTFYKVYKL